MTLLYLRRNFGNIFIFSLLGILGVASIIIYITWFKIMKIDAQIGLIVSIISCWGGFLVSLQNLLPQLEEKAQTKLMKETKIEMEKSRKPQLERVIEKSSLDIAFYLRSKLSNSKVPDGYYKEFEKAIALFSDGFHQYAIIHSTLILEDFINAKMKGKIDKARLSQMTLAEKVNYLQSKKRIGNLDKIKFDLIRSCRNISAHELASKDLQEVFNMAKMLIEISIDLCEKLCQS